MLLFRARANRSHFKFNVYKHYSSLYCLMLWKLDCCGWKNVLFPLPKPEWCTSSWTNWENGFAVKAKKTQKTLQDDIFDKIGVQIDLRKWNIGYENTRSNVMYIYIVSPTRWFYLSFSFVAKLIMDFTIRSIFTICSSVSGFYIWFSLLTKKKKGL